MTDQVTTADFEVRHELQRRSFEALFSLIRSLGTTLEVEKVAKLSLLTVTGQLLVRKAAFFLYREGEQGLALCETAGVRRALLSAVTIPLEADFHKKLDANGGVAPLDSSWGLDERLTEHFQYAAYLRDGDRPVGLLLLGGQIQGRRLDEVDHHLLQTMGVVIGTTVQKALIYEHAMHARMRMEEADRLRSIILDHVSHEFNTPLGVVKSAVDLARSLPQDQQEELFEMHDEAVKRLEYLVNAVMRLAESGAESPTQLSTQRLEETMTEVVRPVLYLRKLEGFLVVEGHLPDPNVTARVDPAKLKLALDGLLHNAWQFRRPDYPWVAVHCYATSRKWWVAHHAEQRLPMYPEILGSAPDERMEPIFAAGEGPPPGPHPDDDMIVVIEVIDAGIGIPAQDLEMVFEPFYQASNSPNRGIKGVGLGLPSCRRMVEDMGGEVLARSVQGQGSLFAIVLPARWARPQNS